MTTTAAASTANVGRVVDVNERRYHIDKATDPDLRRRPTPASVTYRAIVQRRRG
jgi:hypothetical protein